MSGCQRGGLVVFASSMEGMLSQNHERKWGNHREQAWEGGGLLNKCEPGP